jgi:hypothetical protein
MNRKIHVRFWRPAGLATASLSLIRLPSVCAVTESKDTDEIVKSPLKASFSRYLMVVTVPLGHHKGFSFERFCILPYNPLAIFEECINYDT